MADELFLSVAGKRALRARLLVPHQGPWFVEAELDEAHQLLGRVEVRIADLVLSGTVQERAAGTFTLGTALRVIGGAGGWATLCRPLHYHNDARVKAQQIATDAAALAGETLGTFEPGEARVGVDYVRRAVAASQVLEDAAGGIPWWVDYQGVTHVRRRPVGSADGATVLDYDPRARILTLAAIDLAGIAPGLEITDERVHDPQTIRDLEIIVEDGKLRLRAWCGGGQDARGRAHGLLRALARRATGDRIWGVWRYRVVSMAPDGRVRLQAVSKAAVLPDVLPAPQRPGVAGAHSELTAGTEVLVEFVEGRPTMPIVRGFAGKGEEGAIPVSVSFHEGTRPVAAVGDQVSIFMTPGVPVPVVGTMGVPPAASPFTGTATFPGPLIGVISTGSPRVLVE